MINTENLSRSIQMVKLNVSSGDFKEIQNIIKKLYPEAVVWAYGSRLGEIFHEGSELKNRFSDSNIPF